MRGGAVRRLLKAARAAVRRRPLPKRPAWSGPLRRIVSRGGFDISTRAGANDVTQYAGAPPQIRLKKRMGASVTRAAPAITLLHELAHAVGPRLGRPPLPARGTRAYAREEVVAELTANRVARRLGMPASERYNRRSGTRGYVREYVSDYGERRRLRTGRMRTRAEASSIMRDVRAAEDYLLSLSGRRFRRGSGRPVRGGGS